VLREDPGQPQPELRPEPAAEAPRPAPLKLDWPSDLVQIETNPEKARAVTTQIAEEPAPRPRRPRPAPAPASNEPLVQIETRRQQTGGAEHESANTVGQV
jgi:hypothetical protein